MTAFTKTTYGQYTETPYKQLTTTPYTTVTYTLDSGCWGKDCCPRCHQRLIYAGTTTYFCPRCKQWFYDPSMKGDEK